MTPDQPTLPVTQADREMAAFIWFAGNCARDAGPRVREMLDGENDGHLAVQACARHRADHEPRAVEVGLREALEALRERCAQMVYQWYDGEPEVAEELRQIVRTVPLAALAAQSPAPTDGLEGGEGGIAEVLAIHGHGVGMIVDQGLLDHWFTQDHWSDIKPAPAAFAMAENFGLVERHFAGGKFRLTDLGRHHRAIRSATAHPSTQPQADAGSADHSSTREG